MGERAWLRERQPLRMLQFLGARRPTTRKLRLFACATVRTRLELVWQPWRSHVDLAERLADGAAGQAEVEEAIARGRANPRPGGSALAGASQMGFAADDAALATLGGDAPQAARDCANRMGIATAVEAVGVPADDRWANEQFGEVYQGAQAPLCNILRDLFRPYRPVQVDPSWLTWQGGTVAGLARAAYGERNLPAGHLDPSRLAVLADGLEDAGCAVTDILGHLRGPGPHWRGCAVLDALLGMLP
jgi:hypothetical protein